YQVFTAGNGEEAIAEAKKVLPDLIILDVMMPKMDGVEACTRLRAIPQFKNTFIIFLTARNEEYSEMAGFNAGADDYIAKPIKPRILISRINAIMRRSLQPVETVKSRLEIADLVIDRDAFLVYRGSEKIVL